MAKAASSLWHASILEKKSAPPIRVRALIARQPPDSSEFLVETGFAPRSARRKKGWMAMILKGIVSGVRGAAACAALCTAFVASVPVHAQTTNGEAISFDIPAGTLQSALITFADQSGLQLIYAPETVAGRHTRALRADLRAQDALQRLIADSDLRIRQVDARVIMLESNASRGPTSHNLNGAPFAFAGHPVPAEPISIEPQSNEAVKTADATPDESEIIVTGTRIRGQGPIGSVVSTIDRRAIEESGYATVQDIAQTIPQNFAGAPNEITAGISLVAETARNTGVGASLNLRGLGVGSTLVLLNGDRPPLGGITGTFADLSMIPASAIERIEVIADGASAIYGSDAVAGVVNLIPRLDFVGAETNFRVGTADGDSHDLLASQLLGRKWRGGNAVIAYEYYRRARLAASDREFATEDLRRFGGADYRQSYANPGTIIAGGRSFAIPAGQDGSALTAGDLIPDTVNRGDSWYGADLLPTQKRHSLFAAFSQELFPAVRFYARGLYSARDFERRQRPTSNTARTVPVTNPFYIDPIGTGQPVRVQYSFVDDLGPETTFGRVRAYGGSAGFDIGLGKWRFDAHGTWGRQSERTTMVNRVNSARLAAALADTDPATAYNLFGEGPATNPETIARVRGSTRTAYGGTVWSATMRADGPLISIAGGDIRLAVGGEYRNEHYTLSPTVNDTSSLTPIIVPPVRLSGPRHVRAAYGEVAIPVFGENNAVPGIERLDFSAAIRAENYSDVGSTTNPKLGLRWQPASGVTFRSTYGKSFRAPSFSDLIQDPSTSLVFAYTLPDPASPTGSTNVVVIRGNNPDMRPERATTWTLGIDLSPELLTGLRANITYYNVNYRDRITTPAANLLNFLVNRHIYQGIIDSSPTLEEVRDYFAAPIFQNPFNLSPDQISEVVDARLQNLSVVRQSGIDFDVSYQLPLLGGDVELGASGSYIFHIRQALTDTAPVNDVVDILGNPVDFRARARASWRNEKLNVSLHANYIDGYTNLTNVSPQRVDAWTTFDLQIGYRFLEDRGPLKGLKVALSGTNLFDADPPFASYYLGVFAVGYDPDNANPLGRVVSLQLTKSW